MADADINNQVFFFSWVVSGVAGEGDSTVWIRPLGELTVQKFNYVSLINGSEFSDLILTKICS